jgi:hypothetical protein
MVATITQLEGAVILNLVTSIVCQRPTTRSARMHGFTRDQLREVVQIGFAATTSQLLLEWGAPRVHGPIPGTWGDAWRPRSVYLLAVYLLETELPSFLPRFPLPTNG